MAQPTLEQVQKANPYFFGDRELRLFGDTRYTVKGLTLTVHAQRESSTGRTLDEAHQYAIDPNTHALSPIAIDRGNGRRYIFTQHNNTGPVLTQYLKDDGSPDGSPTTDRPNQHER